MKPRIIYFLPAFAWFLIVTILLVIPGEDIPSDPFLDEIYFDKWVHIGLFGALVLLICLPLIRNVQKIVKTFLIVALCVIAYGIAMEYVQKFFTVDRAFDIYDMAADSLGCLIACWLCVRIAKNKKPL